MRSRFSLVISIGLLALSAGLTGCGEKGEHAAPVAEASGERHVVASGLIADLKPVAATVTTRDTGMVTARINGVLTQLLVREGDEVRAGQRLGSVVDARLNLEVGAYAAQAEALAAEAVRAQQDLQRTEYLVERGIYAPARLDQDRAIAEAAKGRLDAARAQQSAAAEIAGQGALLAPSSGKVLSAPVPAGSAVMAGQTIVTVTSGPPVVRIEVPEGQAGALRPGLTVTVRGLEAGDVTGEIAQVYPEVMAGMVRADVNARGLNADLVGRRVQALVPLGERPGVIIPARFVSTRFGVDYVRVLGADGAAGDVPVQLAPGPDADTREVLSGLAAGDTILAPTA